MDKIIKRYLTSKIGIGIICAIVGTSVGVLLTFSLQRIFPNKVIIVPPDNKESLKETDLSSIKSGYPPFVYKFEYLGENVTKGLKREWFSQKEVNMDTWHYRVSLANLSEIPLMNFEIVFESKNSYNSIYIKSKDKRFKISPKKYLGSDEFEVIECENNRFVLLLDFLLSGESTFFNIAILNNLRPSIDDFHIYITCPEGKFTNITPLEWEKIGWEKK